MMEKIVVGSHELPVISVAEETGYLDGVKRLGVVIRLGREAGFDHLKEMFSGRVTIEIFESVDGGSWEKVNELGGYELDHIGYDGKGYSVTLFRRSEITAMREQLQLLIPPEPTTLAGWQARKQGERRRWPSGWRRTPSRGRTESGTASRWRTSRKWRSTSCNTRRRLPPDRKQYWSGTAPNPPARHGTRRNSPRCRWRLRSTYTHL